MELAVLDVSFDWPTPPYFSIAADSNKDAPENCVLYMRDGSKVLGDLLRFSPEVANISFLQNNSEVPETISLEDIKSIRLIRQLILSPQLLALNERAEEVFPPSDKQSFSVEFQDGETITGETLSYANTGNGLYLYIPTGNGSIVRTFIPRSSIRHYQIGQLIGDTLVEENLVSKDEVEAALARQHELRMQRIGDYLSEHQIISREQLETAVKHQESQPILKLGEALIQLKLLTEDQLQTALSKQKENRKVQLGQVLIEMGVLSERSLKGALAKKLGIPYVSLPKFNFDPNATRLISPALARKHTMIPLCISGSTLIIAFENPLNVQAIEELRFVTQLKPVPAMAAGEEIIQAIHQCYGPGYTNPFADDAALDLDGGSEYKLAGSDLKIDDLASKLFDEDSSNDLSLEEPVAESDNTLVQLVNKMIMDAYQDGVSDIHIETYPGKQNTRVRFRKDGTLVPYLEIPANFRNAVISRIKVMALLDIAERRKPQDGKLDFQHFGPAKIELRVATIPTSNNLEDIVMRILASAKPVPMDKLGLEPGSLETLKTLMQRPYGLILVCGPTGSGKTTTLHSLLGNINTIDRKIWTAEDPIEIAQPGLRQVQVNAKTGWTFASAMRSFLRADPDVIMVGEMRDQETTKIGIEASLTGHLVISTLHTNTAPESVTRLLDLGMDPFNFADALLCILAQRLAKTLCKDCKTPYHPKPSELEELAIEYCESSGLDHAQILSNWHESLGKKIALYKANGCPSCNNTGYRGRMGLHELLVVTPKIKRLIQTRAPVSELLQEAISSGMHTLKQDGILKVLQGNTDIAQVRAVCV